MTKNLSPETLEMLEADGIDPNDPNVIVFEGPLPEELYVTLVDAYKAAVAAKSTTITHPEIGTIDLDMAEGIIEAVGRMLNSEQYQQHKAETQRKMH